MISEDRFFKAYAELNLINKEIEEYGLLCKDLKRRSDGIEIKVVDHGSTIGDITELCDQFLNIDEAIEQYIEKLREEKRDILADLTRPEPEPEPEPEPMMLMTPDQWFMYFSEDFSEDGFRMYDPDGWRRDNKSYTDPITKDEFVRRCYVSTTTGKPGREYERLVIKLIS